MMAPHARASGFRASRASRSRGAPQNTTVFATMPVPVAPAVPISMPIPTVISTTETIIQQEQSMEIIKIAVTAIMSAIVQARQAFHNQPFKNLSCDPNDPDTSYTSFVTGNHPFQYDPSSSISMWRILDRGQNTKADKLLDWLEIGVADALQRELLSKLQLAFHSGVDGPLCDSNLLESYTMAFSYKNGAVAMEFSSESGDQSVETGTMMLHTAKQQLVRLVDDVVYDFWVRRKHLPPLPPKRRMNMTLSYNDNCPEGWQPKGFEAGDEETSKILARDVFDGNFTMETSFHKLSVGLSLPQPMEEHVQALQIAENRISSENRAPSLANKDVPTANLLHGQLPRLVSSLISSSEGGGTQPEALRDLRKMGTYRDPNGETQDTQPLQETPTVPANTLTIHTQPIPGLLPYVSHINTQIRRALERYDQSSGEDCDFDEPQDTQGALVCECKALMDEGNLMRCVICCNSQHVQCYGYLGSSPGSPSTGVCYTCLSQLDGAGVRLSEISDICIKRRALYYLLETKGLASLEDLANYLSRHKSAANRVLNILKNEGYIREGPGMKRHGKGKQDDLLYLFVREELLSNYFFPEKGIAHLISDLDTSSSGGTFAHESTSGTSPPPSASAPALENTSSAGHITRSQNVRAIATPERVHFGDVSSTEGTPSTTSRYSSHYWKRSGLQNFDQQFNANVGSSSLVNKKRKARTALEKRQSKLVRVWQVNSPQVEDN